MDKPFDSSCRKCGAPMPGDPSVNPKGPPIMRIQIRITGYRCPCCDHWNDLKRRKGWRKL